MAACMSARIREPRTNCKAVGRRSPLQTDDGSVWCRCRQKRKETSTTVVATTDIPPHVTFGPYPCGLDFSIRTSDQPSSEMVVKITWQGDRLTLDEEALCDVCCRRPDPHDQDAKTQWMAALQPARDRHEQNVEVLAVDGHLALRVLKPVRQGERMLLWYSDALGRAYGVPILTPAHIQGNQEYLCIACRKIFQYPNTLKAHVMFRCKAIDSDSKKNSKSGIYLSSDNPTTSIVTPAHTYSLYRSAFRKVCALGESAVLFTKPYTSRYHSSMLAESMSESVSVNMQIKERTSKEERQEIQSENDCKTNVQKPITDDSSTDEMESSILNVSVMNNTSPFNTFCKSAYQNSSEKNASKSFLSNANPLWNQSFPVLRHLHHEGFSISLNQHETLRCHPWLSLMTSTGPANFSMSSISSPFATVDYLQDPLLSLEHNSSSFTFQKYHIESQNQPICISPPDIRPSHSLGGTLRARISVSQEPKQLAPGRTLISETCSKPSMPFLSVPKESKSEPLDLLPPSFFTCKSRKGHLCVYCGKLYSRKYGLKIHLRTHTGYKPLKCKVCSRPFGDPSNLNKHVRLHAQGNTPYRCDFCGKVLVRRRDLERHIRSRHPSYAKKHDITVTDCTDSEQEMLSESDSCMTKTGDSAIKTTERI